jgi:peptidyl-prolyl cis-trans isomerase C
MVLPTRRPRHTILSAALIGLTLLLTGCGLGRDSQGDGAGITNPIVAATVNGRPIYVEDVRAYAVARGWLQETEDLDANSDAFYVALEELIEVRLFSMEAEARGLDRDANVRRQLESARERVLANSIYEEIDRRAVDPEAIERLYRENASRLGQGEEIHLRHIQFDTREAADAAKRRLEQGERFEALAFELSTERDSAADGGDLGFAAVSDLASIVRQAVDRATVGDVIGPLQLPTGWHLFRVEDRRTRGVPSLETLRPRIVDWLRYQEITQLNERLARDARIERLREPETAHEPGADAAAPADATPPAPARPQRPTPDIAGTPGQQPPPFPFPMGPSGVTGAPPPQPQPQAAPAPATQTPAGPTP